MTLGGRGGRSGRGIGDLEEDFGGRWGRAARLGSRMGFLTKLVASRTEVGKWRSVTMGMSWERSRERY